jgi:hypothetical protein
VARAVRGEAEFVTGTPKPMKVLIAGSSTSALAATEGYARALRDRLQVEGHRVEQLDLPSIGVGDEAAPNLASYRLMDTAASADAIICLDPVAAVLPHPRKFCWLLDSASLDVEAAPTGSERLADRLFIARVLRRGIDEARGIYVPSPFALRTLHGFGFDRAVLCAPSAVPEPARYSRNSGPELLVLLPLADRQRPDLLIATLEALPEPFRLRWVASCADAGALGRVRKLAEDRGVADRFSVDVRRTEAGERSYLLSQAAALVDLMPGAMAIADGVRLAFQQGVPVIAGTDGGATADAVPNASSPTPESLAEVIMASCGRETAAAPVTAEVGSWSSLLEGITS